MFSSPNAASQASILMLMFLNHSNEQDHITAPHQLLVWDFYSFFDHFRPSSSQNAQFSILQSSRDSKLDECRAEVPRTLGRRWTIYDDRSRLPLFLPASFFYFFLFATLVLILIWVRCPRLRSSRLRTGSRVKNKLSFFSFLFCLCEKKKPIIVDCIECMGKFTVCTSMKPKHRTYFIPSRGWEKKKTRDSNTYWSTGKKCIPGIRIGMGFEWHLDCKFSVDFNGNAIYGTREREKERWRFFCFIFDC
jgi:hypothetical protein